MVVNVLYLVYIYLMMADIMRELDEFESSAPSKKETIRQIQITTENLSTSPEYLKGIVWPESVMKVVLARKATHRLDKQIPFNYMVTEFKPKEDQTDHSLEGNEELASLIQFLKVNLKKLPIGLRFQLAVLIKGHWTAVDNLVTTKGISSFNLDAVMDSKARHFFLVYLTNLQKEGLLNAGYTYYVSVPSEGPFAKTPKEKVANMIQTDFVSCGIFLVDHLSFLSRANVFHHLKNAVGEFQYKTLGRSDIPPSLSAIFRLSQSNRLIRSLTSKQTESTVTRKGKKLSEVRTQANSKDPLVPSIYANAKKKGSEMLNNAERYVADSDEETYKRIFSYNLLEQLSDYAQNYSKPVNELIAFIYNALPECKSLTDEESIRLMEKLHKVILLPDCNDMQKIIEITKSTISSLEKINEVAAYRLMTAVLSYAALNINDNKQLWDFYNSLLNSPVIRGLSTNTNSFFNTPSRFTPALISHIEKAVKIQLLYNAASGLCKAQENQLNLLLDSSEIKTFLNKPLTFDTSETKSTQLLNQLIPLKSSPEDLAQVYRLASSVKETLEQRKKEVFSEFGFDTTAPPAEPYTL